MVASCFRGFVRVRLWLELLNICARATQIVMPCVRGSFVGTWNLVLGALGVTWAGCISLVLSSLVFVVSECLGVGILHT